MARPARRDREEDPIKRAARPSSTRRLTLTSSGDRNDLEALQLEIRRLAREHGVEVSEVRIDRVERRPARRRR
jgi:hypothetical protein